MKRCDLGEVSEGRKVEGKQNRRPYLVPRHFGRACLTWTRSLLCPRMSAPFSSFPTFNSFPVLDPGSSKQVSTGEDTHKTKTNDRKHDERRSRRDDKDKRRHEDKSRQETRERRTEGRSRASHEATPTSMPSASDSATRFFYSDRKGDKLNVKYGGLHAGDIPKYRLVGRE